MLARCRNELRSMSALTGPASRSEQPPIDNASTVTANAIILHFIGLFLCWLMVSLYRFASAF